MDMPLLLQSHWICVYMCMCMFTINISVYTPVEHIFSVCMLSIPMPVSVENNNFMK